MQALGAVAVSRNTISRTSAFQDAILERVARFRIADCGLRIGTSRGVIAVSRGGENESCGDSGVHRLWGKQRLMKGCLRKPALFLWRHLGKEGGFCGFTVKGHRCFRSRGLRLQTDKDTRQVGVD